MNSSQTNNQIALISDIHFGVRKNSELFLKSQTKFFYEQFFPYLKANGIEKILILGDVFESRTSIDVRIEEAALDFFKEPFQFDILIGNHDLYYNNDNSTSSLKMLEKYENVNIINAVTLDNETGFAYIPWIVDKDKFLSGIESHMTSDVCFGHFDLCGFNILGNHISKNWLTPEHLKGFKKVYSGHFHTKSCRQYGNTTVTYLGCPYWLDRNDKGQEKGFYIFNTDTYEDRFIENTVSSRFIDIKYPEPINKDIIRDNFIDVYVKEDDVNLNEIEFNKYLAEINACNPIRNATVVVEKNKDYLNNDVEIVTESKSIIDLIKDFVNVQEKIENKESLVEKLFKIYEECLEE